MSYLSKLKNSASDTTPGYLSSKIISSTGIIIEQENIGLNELIKISSPNSGTDERAKISVNDTTTSYLANKLIASSGIVMTLNNPGGDEYLSIAVIPQDATFTDIYDRILSTSTSLIIKSDDLLNRIYNTSTALVVEIDNRLIAEAGLLDRIYNTSTTLLVAKDDLLNRIYITSTNLIEYHNATIYTSGPQTLDVTQAFIVCNDSAGFTVNLPTPDGSYLGKEYHIKNINTGSITIDGGSTNIDDATTASVSQYQSMSVKLVDTTGAGAYLWIIY